MDSKGKFKTHQSLRRQQERTRLSIQWEPRPKLFEAETAQFWANAFSMKLEVCWDEFISHFESGPNLTSLKPLLSKYDKDTTLVTKERFTLVVAWFSQLFTTNSSESQREADSLLKIFGPNFVVTTAKRAEEILLSLQNPEPRKCYLIRPSTTDPFNTPFTISCAVPKKEPNVLEYQHLRVNFIRDHAISHDPRLASEKFTATQPIKDGFFAEWWPPGEQSPGTAFASLEEIMQTVQPALGVRFTDGYSTRVEPPTQLIFTPEELGLMCEYLDGLKQLYPQHQPFLALIANIDAKLRPVSAMKSLVSASVTNEIMSQLVERMKSLNLSEAQLLVLSLDGICFLSKYFNELQPIAQELGAPPSTEKVRALIQRIHNSYRPMSPPLPSPSRPVTQMEIVTKPACHPNNNNIEDDLSERKGKRKADAMEPTTWDQFIQFGAKSDDDDEQKTVSIADLRKVLLQSNNLSETAVSDIINKLIPHVITVQPQVAVSLDNNWLKFVHLEEKAAETFWNHAVGANQTEVRWEYLIKQFISSELDITRFKSLLCPGETPNVTKKRFECVAGWFNRLFSNPTSPELQREADDILAAEWFHGDVTSGGAAQIQLDNMRKTNHGVGKYFMMRPSATDPFKAPFTVTHTSAIDPKIPWRHLRINIIRNHQIIFYPGQPCSDTILRKQPMKEGYFAEWWPPGEPSTGFAFISLPFFINSIQGPSTDTQIGIPCLRSISIYPTFSPSQQLN
jgi:hypothetical protein